MRLVAVLIAAALAAAACSPTRIGQEGAGFISHTLCSAVFVSGQDGDRAYQDAVLPETLFQWLNWGIRYDIDKVHQEIRTRLFGGFEVASEYHPGSGCRSRVGGTPSAPRTPQEYGPRGAALLPPIAGPEVVVAKDPRLAEAVASAFSPTDSGDGQRTKAVVVVHKGRIIAEQYGEGYGKDTRIPGFSDTKAVVSALIGILVRQGKVSPQGPAPLAEWSGKDDPRRAITVEHLLQMRSGLKWDESLGAGPGDVAQMLYLERDLAGFALAMPLDDPAGSKWQYNSGGTMVLSRILRDAAGGTREGFLKFAHQELFDPLGMERVEFDIDATGTPVGSEGMSATARDWARFGVLYAQDGVVGGRRILPEGWAEFSGTPAPNAWVGYGAGFWTNRGDSKGAYYRTKWGMPNTSYYASGLLGQIILVVPEEQLVIARFGWSHGAYGGMEEISTVMGKIVAAVRAGK